LALVVAGCQHIIYVPIRIGQMANKMTNCLTFVAYSKAMFYLLATTLLATSIFIIFRYFKKFGVDNLQAITANYMVAGTIGFITYEKPFGVSTIIEAPWLPIVLLIGVFFIAVFFLFALSTQKAGIAITAVSSKMSVVIPATGGFIFFGDQLSVLKLAGIVAALLAFYFTFKTKGKMVVNYGAMLLPILLFVGTGTNDLLMKYTDFRFVGDDLLLKISTIFMVSLAAGSILLIVKYIRGEVQLRLRNFLFGFFLGFVNFASTYTLFRSMEYFDSSLMFPIRNTGVVALSALAGLWLFSENLNRTNWMGIALAILAIILIAAG
jgi:drug/metabolite transporter (DMT)-like permease